MLEICIFMFLFTGMCFVFWNAANQALNGGSYIEPHLREATYWWVQWGLWVPAVIMILMIVIGVLASVESPSARRRRSLEWIDRTIAESDRRIAQLNAEIEEGRRRLSEERQKEMDPTQTERELRRQIRDLGL